MHLLQPAYIPVARHRWLVDDLRAHAAYCLEHRDLDRTRRGLRAGALDDAVAAMARPHGGLDFFLLAAMASTRFQIKNDPFRGIEIAVRLAPAWYVVATAIVAFLLPARPAGTQLLAAPSPWLPGMIALVAGSIFLIAPHLGMGRGGDLHCPRPDRDRAVVTVMSRRSGWGGSHPPGPCRRRSSRLRAGMHFCRSPPTATTGPTVWVSHVVCLLIALALIFFAARRQSRSEADSLQ